MKKIVLAMKSLVPAVAIALLLAQETANAQGRLAPECPSEAAIRSLSDTERTRISFRNERAGSIYVFWLDYEGQRQLYRTLAPRTKCDLPNICDASVRGNRCFW